MLIKEVKHLMNTPVKSLVNQRIKEFKEPKSPEKIFSELCFCILTANFNAERCVRIQEAIGNGFLSMKKKELAKKLKEMGHRFPNKRAEYIVEARGTFSELMDVLHSEKNGPEIREYLVKNIKGLGYKEASHFLRNIGFDDLAILDFHILDLLEKYGIIKKPRTLSRRKYLEIERKLKDIAEDLNISLAELDLYLWYMETGKVLK